eukprot:364287-Chlamydomonas_euryale.AAC.11
MPVTPCNSDSDSCGLSGFGGRGMTLGGNDVRAARDRRPRRATGVGRAGGRRGRRRAASAGGASTCNSQSFGVHPMHARAQLMSERARRARPHVSICTRPYACVHMHASICMRPSACVDRPLPDASRRHGTTN